MDATAADASAHILFAISADTMKATLVKWKSACARLTRTAAGSASVATNAPSAATGPEEEGGDDDDDDDDDDVTNASAAPVKVRSAVLMTAFVNAETPPEDDGAGDGGGAFIKVSLGKRTGNREGR